jgi:hypothetical protein
MNIEQLILNSLRFHRNRLLAETDWTQLPDCPLSSEMKLMYQQYRQTLRDLPQTAHVANLSHWDESVAENVFPKKPTLIGAGNTQ